MGKNSRIGAIVQARVDSSRLPKKVLIKLQGKTVLQHVIERVKKATTLDLVVVAIPDTEEDKKLASIARLASVPCFAGSKENVLDRAVKCAEKFAIGTIVRICADCPLIDPTFIDLAVRQHQMQGNDYTTAVNVLPVGIDFEVVSLDALKAVSRATKEKRHLEHHTWFIRENKELFKVGLLREGKQFYRSGLKLTLDTEADLQLLKELPKRLGKELEGITTRDLVELFDKNKPVFKNS